jgi:hypothetical protein
MVLEIAYLNKCSALRVEVKVCDMVALIETQIMRMTMICLTVNNALETELQIGVSDKARIKNLNKLLKAAVLR